MKQKRYFRTVVCLVLGAVLLTGSVFANYENASGYTKIKNAVLNMMTVENFSGTMNYSTKLNGKDMETASSEFKYNRNGSTSQYSKETGNGSDYEAWIQDGMTINKNGEDYTVSQAYNKGFNDDYLSYTDEEKDYHDKWISFAELFADTLVGDLKNNVVLASTDNGSSTYQLNLSKNQIPELIQSGLNLITSSSSYNSGGYVSFENYEAHSDEEYEELWEKAYEYLEEKGNTGVVYVMEDGTFKYFETEYDYTDYMGYNDSLSSFLYRLQDDAAIDVVNCQAVLDSEGRLSEATASVTFTGQDKDGNNQSLTYELSFSAYDYGTTSIDAFDLSKLNYNWDNLNTDDYFYFTFNSNGNLTFDSSAEYEYDENGNIINNDQEPTAVEDGGEATPVETEGDDATDTQAPVEAPSDEVAA